MTLKPVQKLHEAEVVLGVIVAGLSEDAGMSLRKNIIVMSYPASAPELQRCFGSNVVVIDPANPDGAGIGIVQHLRSIDAQQNAKKALSALGTLALGLLILAPADLAPADRN